MGSLLFGFTIMMPLDQGQLTATRPPHRQDVIARTHDYGVQLTISNQVGLPGDFMQPKDELNFMPVTPCGILLNVLHNDYF